MGGPEAGAGPANGANPDPVALFRAHTAAIHETIDQVCTLLVEPTPEHLDRSADLLAQAMTRLAACREMPAGSGRSSPAVVQIRQLQTGLARARRLLEASAAFYAGWVSCAGALCAGYTRGGQPGALAGHSRLWAEG
jgi:hypothetical protein